MKIFRLSILFIFIFISTKVSAQVTAGFTVAYQNPNCAPTTVTFTSTSTGAATLEWNFGVNPGVNSTLPTPSFTYLVCGNYTVMLAAFDGVGGTDTVWQTINIYCSPIASLNVNPTSGCIPLPANFTSTTTLGSAPITTYFWDFGDGNVGSGANPIHPYTISGCKNITLIVTDANGCSDDTTMNNLICVDEQPVADFTSITNISCSAPYTVDFTNTSTGNGVLNYEWLFPGGVPATSTLQNPSTLYNIPGLYDVTLIVTNSSGCSDTVTYQNFAAIAANTADFTMNDNAGCVPFTLNVAGISSPGALAWSWTTTPAALPPTANTQNASFLFNTNGAYQVCLEITYPGGCIAQRCTTIIVSNYPNASFTLTGNVYTCNPPQIIDYNNTSTGGVGMTYAWQFPGGVPAFWNGINPPNVTYNDCGVYDATLVVTNQSGCSDTFTYAGAANIDCPQATFIALPLNGCSPLPVSFLYVGTSGAPTSWSWNFGEPSSGAANFSILQNPNHIYTTLGCHDVSLIVNNAAGCADTIGHPDLICLGVPPVANFSATPVITCAYQSIAFTSLSTGTDSTTTYQWDFLGSPPFDIMNTSQSPDYLYPDTGLFDVTLVVCNNGCCDTLQIVDYITILPPIANFTVLTDCATPDSITFDGTSSIAADTFFWSTPGGNPSSVSDSIITVYYPTNGTYSVQLIVQNYLTGCYDTVNQSVIVNHVLADFVASDTAICAPDQICFTNLSQNAVSYQWSLYNGAGVQLWGSNAVNPCHNFNFPGKFSMKLVATDANGCTDTMYKYLYIYAYGVNLNFSGTPLSGCIPLDVAFTSSSVSFVSTIVSYYWDFGDTASGLLDTASVQNPNHIYNNPGSYTVSLVAMEDHGCYDTLIIPFYVNPYQPIAEFMAPDTLLCLGESACFLNTSFGGSLSYDWDFGDGSTSTSLNPCHQYNTAGIFTVTLIATDTAGCADTLVKNFYIHVSDLHASFIADSTYSFCPPLPVNFTSTSTGVDSTATYEWYFGDGSNSNVQNPFHIYNASGFYDVTLIVHNASGCSDTLVIDSMISITGPTVTLNVSPTSGCVPLTVCFDATSSAATSFTWDFGDGNVVPNANDTFCYTYLNPGTFYPSLLLDDGNGCVFTFAIDSIVAGGPDVNWITSSSILCQSGTVNFTDSTFGISPITGWLWTFGDAGSGVNDTSILQNPSHFYSSIGTYVVTLSVNTLNGCSDFLTDTIFVTPPPTIGINASNLNPCINSSVDFNYNSTQPITNFFWNFGDPLSGANDSSNLATPSHTFSSGSGNFAVTLIADANNGCSDTTTLIINVQPLPIPNISNDTAICPGNSVSISASNGVTYAWSPATYLSSTNISNPVSTPATNITYSVVVTSASGCIDSASMSITINIPPVVTASSIVSDTTCAGVAIQLFGGGAATYIWQPTAVLNNNALQNPTATIFNNTTFTVTGTDANGCTGDATLVITVLPTPPINAGLDAAFCFGGNAQLNVSGGNTYAWTPANGLSCTTCQSPVASPTITTTYSVTATDTNNCVATDDVIITVYQLPVANAGADDTACLGQSITLNASGGVSYSWVPPTFLNNSSIQNPICTPLANTTYFVTVTDGNACSAGDSVIIIVLPAPVFNAWGDTTICAETEIQLHASGGTSYSWSPAAGLSNAFTDEPYCSPTFTTIFSVIITDDVCSISDTLQVTVNVDPLPIANAGPDAEITAGDSYNINGSASGTYSWSSPLGLSCITCEDPIATPLENTTYTLTATNEFGCMKIDSMIITVMCSDDILYIPNVFSPNGNGKNDIFKVRSSGIRELNFLRVYDRWGELVFETSDANVGWDGTFHNVQLPPAVYVYYLKAVCGDGFNIERHGNVTLVR